MMDMEVENTDDQLVTIHFDDNVDDTFNKQFLVENSAYFEAMFSGNFKESESEQKIHIQVSIDLSIIKIYLLFNGSEE